MWIRSQGTYEEYRKIRQGYEIDNRKIFGEYAEDVIDVKERAGVKHNTIYEKLHKEKEMMEAKMLLPYRSWYCGVALNVSENKKTGHFKRNNRLIWYARRDSNPRPFGS